MQKIILAPLALAAAACSPASEEGKRVGDSQTSTSSVADASPTFYIHCLGRDVHLRNHQPHISLSFELNESRPREIKIKNDVFPMYDDVCSEKSSKCDVTVTSNQIILATEDDLGGQVKWSRFMDIDRITGEFKGSEFIKTKEVEATSYLAVGRCQRSSSPISPSAI